MFDAVLIYSSENDLGVITYLFHDLNFTNACLKINTGSHGLHLAQDISYQSSLMKQNIDTIIHHCYAGKMGAVILKSITLLSFFLILLIKYRQVWWSYFHSLLLVRICICWHRYTMDWNASSEKVIWFIFVSIIIKFWFHVEKSLVDKKEENEWKMWKYLTRRKRK